MAFSIDYRSFSPQGQKLKPSDYQWWKKDKKERPKAIADVVGLLQKAQERIDAQREINMRLYGMSPLYGSSSMSATKQPQAPAVRDRITYNLVSSVIDTLTSKIAKNKPKPLFLTERGNYKLQRKAQKLNQFTDGIFFENHLNTLRPLLFRDAAVIGTAVIHGFDYYGQVALERVLAQELIVDEKEAEYGIPRSLYRLKNVDRLVLADMFPSMKSKIMDALPALDPVHKAAQVADVITVCEAWHLPSGPKATDGCHSVCIADHELNDDTTWTRKYFPFAFYHYSKRMRGFWGQACAERLQNMQLEVNKALWIKQRSLHLMGSFKILIENGSKIVKEHLNNDIGAIVTYTGTPPQYVTPPAVAMEIDQWIASLIQRAYEQEGISLLSATAQKPAGLDSGKALREYNDIETERFMVVGQNWQEFALDTAALVVDQARENYKKYKKLQAKIPGGRFVDSINWKDVDMSEDQYVMQCFPISSLPQDPAGRTATVQEWIQAGWIDPRQGKRLMDFPDIDQYTSLTNAVEERILDALDKIVDDGEYTPPDQFMEPGLARQLSLEYYNLYATQGLEEERLDMIRTFMLQLDDLEAKAAQPPPGMPVPSPEAGIPGQIAEPQALSPGLSLPPPMAPPPLQ